MAKFVEMKTISVSCPVCDSAQVVRHGKRQGVQRYRCSGCGLAFRGGNTLLGRRVSVDQVGTALDMYYDGLSYKRVAETMATAHKIPEPSISSIYDWVRAYTDVAQKALDGHKPKLGTVWVADEMSVNVGGKQHWLWNVMDSKTRYILAVHLSARRDTREAEKVMEKARRAAGNLPKRIKTDKLGSYIGGIDSTFGGEVEHVQSDGIRALVNNNMSERLQGTFRGRTKVMRGLKTRDSGQAFLDGWIIDYNYFRPHKSLGGKTPADVAGIDVPLSSWVDVVKLSVKRRPPREFVERSPRDRTFKRPKSNQP